MVQLYCCLGVLGEISGYNDTKIDMDSLLSSKDRCGLKTDDGTPTDKDGHAVPIKIKVKGTVETYDDLASANDNGISFRRIANWIEKNYKLL